MGLVDDPPALIVHIHIPFQCHAFAVPLIDIHGETEQAGIKISLVMTAAREHPPKGGGHGRLDIRVSKFPAKLQQRLFFLAGSSVKFIKAVAEDHPFDSAPYRRFCAVFGPKLTGT